jgi:hypothetical protein
MSSRPSRSRPLAFCRSSAELNAGASASVALGHGCARSRPALRAQGRLWPQRRSSPRSTFPTSPPSGLSLLQQVQTARNGELDHARARARRARRPRKTTRRTATCSPSSSAIAAKGARPPSRCTTAPDREADVERRPRRARARRRRPTPRRITSPHHLAAFARAQQERRNAAAETSPHAAGTDSPPVAASPHVVAAAHRQQARRRATVGEVVDRQGQHQGDSHQAGAAGADRKVRLVLLAHEAPPHRRRQHRPDEEGAAKGKRGSRANAQVKEAPGLDQADFADVTEFNAGDLDDAYWGAGRKRRSVGQGRDGRRAQEETSVQRARPTATARATPSPPAAIITQDEDLAGDIVPVALPAAKAAAAPQPTAAPPANAAAVTAKPAAPARRRQPQSRRRWPRVTTPAGAAQFGGDDDSDDDVPSGNPMMLADEDLDGPEQVFSAPAAKRAEVFREPPKPAAAKPAPVASAQVHSAVDDFDPTGDDDDGDDGDVFSTQSRRTAATAAVAEDDDDDLFSAPPAKPAAPPSSRLPQPKAEASRPAMVEEDEDPFGEVATEAANSLVLDEEDPFGDMAASSPAVAAPRGGGAVRGRGGPPPAGAMRGRVRGRARGAPPPSGRGGRPPRRPSRAP